MTAYTLAARETVREQVEAVRERIAMGDDSPERLRKVINKCCLGLFDSMPATRPHWDEIELLARLAADVASILQQREDVANCDVCNVPKPRDTVHLIVVAGSETWACDDCREAGQP